MGKRILYVSDLPVDTRARELAREFEHYGPIIRCDIPAPKRDSRFSYAFVEYEDSRDASDAYHRLHGKPYRGGTIRLEWAKRGPETRRDRDRSDRRIDGASTRDTRGRSRSPRRSDNEDEDRKRDRSHDDRNDIDLDKKSFSPRRPSRSPKNRSISRSASPLVRSSPSSPARYDQDQI